MKKTSFIKKYWKYIVTGFVFLIIGFASGPSEEDLTSETKKVKEEKAIVASLDKEISTKNKEISQLKSEIETLNSKVEEAKPWFEMAEKDKERKLAEQKAAEEKRLAAEKAKADAEAKAKAEAEAKAKAEAERKEKIGYNTGITYDQLARTPDDYVAEKVKFKGKVIQVMEGDGETQIRLAVNDDYDTILYGAYDSSILTSRVLEDDYITIYGLSGGLLSYQSAMGGQISIPSVLIQKIER